MKKLVLAILVAMQTTTVFAKDTSMKREVASSSRASQPTFTWAGIRSDIVRLTLKFQSNSLTDDQKENLLPITNQVLSYMQELTVTQEEKMDQIDVVVKLLAASLQYDFASSNEDTVFFEYIKFKGAYRSAIKMIPDANVRRDLLETFADLEESTKQQSESSN